MSLSAEWRKCKNETTHWYCSVFEIQPEPAPQVRVYTSHRLKGDLRITALELITLRIWIMSLAIHDPLEGMKNEWVFFWRPEQLWKSYILILIDMNTHANCPMQWNSYFYSADVLSHVSGIGSFIHFSLSLWSPATLGPLCSCIMADPAIWPQLPKLGYVKKRISLCCNEYVTNKGLLF